MDDYCIVSNNDNGTFPALPVLMHRRIERAMACVLSLVKDLRDRFLQVVIVSSDFSRAKTTAEEHDFEEYR